MLEIWVGKDMEFFDVEQALPNFCHIHKHHFRLVYMWAVSLIQCKFLLLGKEKV